jgi:uncharacterized damage-inducible protein DinB
MTERKYPDMWVDPEDDPRETATAAKGEKAILAQYLDHYRTTLEMKCEGLDAEQLARRSVPPSTLSPLGMVRHMARVEQSWFRRVIEGRTNITRFFQDEDGGFEFDVAVVDDALVAEAWQLWRDEVAYAREVLERTDLDALVDVHGDPTEVRDIVVHMIEEYARHCGHLDLLRECIDGRTGQ